MISIDRLSSILELMEKFSITSLEMDGLSLERLPVQPVSPMFEVEEDTDDSFSLDKLDDLIRSELGIDN